MPYSLSMLAIWATLSICSLSKIRDWHWHYWGLHRSIPQMHRVRHSGGFSQWEFLLLSIPTWIVRHNLFLQYHQDCPNGWEYGIRNMVFHEYPDRHLLYREPLPFAGHILHNGLLLVNRHQYSVCHWHRKCDTLLWKEYCLSGLNRSQHFFIASSVCKPKHGSILVYRLGSITCRKIQYGKTMIIKVLMFFI